jgi:hypothetical protein
LKVFLRNRDTGLFFQTLDKWTTARQRALHFKSSARAIKTVSDLRLQNMEIVLSFGNPAYDVMAPVGGDQSPI